MLSGEGTQTVEKTTIGLMNKKSNLESASRFFLYISLPLFCTTTTWKFQKRPSYRFYKGKVVRVLVPFFFFHCGSFSPWWPLVFLFFSPPRQIFHVVLPTKNALRFYVALALCRSFSRWASLACRLFSLFLCLSLSLYSKFVDMIINLSLIL